MSTANVIPLDMVNVADKPSVATHVEHHLCPGCGESIAIRLIGEVIEELGVRDRAIGVAGVGCHSQAAYQLDVDFQQAPHGRPPAQATGVKRMLPDSVVFTVQGDGDLMAEGMLEGVQAAARGEKITVICFNNSLFADTGSHMTPTTLIGQKTKTTWEGRNQEDHGSPIRYAEMIATLEGTAYSTRTVVNSPANIQRTRKALKKAFETQMEGKGFSYVEILTMCPSGWFITPVEALGYMDEKMIPTFPLGTFKG
jgi:2-oxoglutarate ferredoxin oxidoreductase subunit beta